MTSDIASTPLITNDVINALLEAFYDILDSDGKKSILALAGLDNLNDQKLPTAGSSPFATFIRLVDAMRTLLQYSDKILFEIGRKFAIYFDPFGSSFPEFVHRLEHQMLELCISTKELTSQHYEIEIGTRGRKTSLLSDKWMYYFYTGIFYEGFRKSSGADLKVNLLTCNEDTLRLEIIVDKQNKNKK